MVEGQPGDAPVALADMHAVRMGGEVRHQRLVGDDDAVREAGRAARILQIGDVVRLRRVERAGRHLGGEEARPVLRLEAGRVGGVAGHRQVGREEQQGRVGAVQLHGELVDIGVLAAERGRQGQRHRPGAGIHGAEEEGDELGGGLGDQGDAVAGPDAARLQAVRGADRILAQLGIGIDARQSGARVVEIHALLALRDIVQRLGHRREVRVAARQLVVGRRRHERLRRRGARLHLAVMVKHVRLNPSSWASWSPEFPSSASALRDEARS